MCRNVQVVRLIFANKFIKFIKITNCVCVPACARVAVYATVMTLLWCALGVYTIVCVAVYVMLLWCALSVY